MLLPSWAISRTFIRVSLQRAGLHNICLNKVTFQIVTCSNLRVRGGEGRTQFYFIWLPFEVLELAVCTGPTQRKCAFVTTVRTKATESFKDAGTVVKSSVLISKHLKMWLGRPCPKLLSFFELLHAHFWVGSTISADSDCTSAVLW